MNSWIADFKKEEANVPYCCYCLTRQGSKFSCCDEVHFVPFSELPDYEQEIIIDDEYAEAMAKIEYERK